jgi:hypothetical protein
MNNQTLFFLIGKNLRKGSEHPLVKVCPKKKIQKKERLLVPLYQDEYYLFAINAITQDSLDIPNAGGSSSYSEALSIQYFQDLGATHFLFEKQVDYEFYSCKMVDFVMTWNKERIGVSVARAMTFSSKNPFDSHRAHTLLSKKLDGLIIARNCVSAHHRFYRSILHVQCETYDMVRLLQDVYQKMLQDTTWYESLQGTLSLVLTRINASSPFCNRVFNRTD